MKTVCKKLFCLMLVAMLLVSAVPAAFAAPWDGMPSIPGIPGIPGIPSIPGNPDLTPDEEEEETAKTTQFWIEIRIEDENITDSKAIEDFPADKVEDEAYIKAQAKKVFASYFEGREIVGFEQENTIGAAVYLKAKADNDNNRPGQNDNNGRPGQNDNNDRPGQNDNNRPGQNDNNRPGQDNNNRPGEDDKHDKNDRPGNGPNKPGFKWETVELTVVYNFSDNYRHLGKTSETFKVWKGSDILDALEDAEDDGYYDVPTRDGYTLAGYSFDKECKHDVNRDDEINGNLTIYCEWEKSKVTLRVYTNSDTKYPDRTFSLDSYARDGKITRTEVEDLLDTKYSAKSGYTLAYYGLFTEKTWDHGDYDKDDAVSSISVNKKGETVIYVMVKNVKKSTADSTNPKTGDNIMIAVTTMTLAAVAVVSMVELKKRKMI